MHNVSNNYDLALSRKQADERVCLGSGPIHRCNSSASKNTYVCFIWQSIEAVQYIDNTQYGVPAGQFKHAGAASEELAMFANGLML